MKENGKRLKLKKKKQHKLNNNGNKIILIGKVHQDEIMQAREELVVPNLNKEQHRDNQEQVRIGELKAEGLEWQKERFHYLELKLKWVF